VLGGIPVQVNGLSGLGAKSAKGDQSTVPKIIGFIIVRELGQKLRNRLYVRFMRNMICFGKIFVYKIGLKYILRDNF
jgi:hypothetical protein